MLSIPYSERRYIRFLFVPKLHGCRPSESSSGDLFDHDMAMRQWNRIETGDGLLSNMAVIRSDAVLFDSLSIPICCACFLTVCSL